MSKKISEKVTWVGKIDWQLHTFHGDELSTSHGSSYNAYLIRDQKTVLVDTVWEPYDKEFVARLKEEIDLKEIDYIVMNHCEIDHSGALPELMREIPDTPIYCTKAGENILKGHYHQNWNFINVKTGDTLKIGESTLTFFEAPFLHWPDTMFTYLDSEQILFTNDAFGQHYATESLFNDLNCRCEIQEEAIKYYANIVTPFGLHVKNRIAALSKMNWPIKMILTSHGVSWRNNPMEIVEQYLKWADDYQENQITLIYDTMWNSTRIMAESIAQGIIEADPQVKVKLINCAKGDKSDILTQVFKSKAILVGSCTYNGGYLYSVAGMLEIIRGSKFKKKSAAAFGSYGWSGEAVKLINEELVRGGFQLVNDGLRLQWIPDEEKIEQCRQYGRDFVASLAQQK